MLTYQVYLYRYPFELLSELKAGKSIRVHFKGLKFGLVAYLQNLVIFPLDFLDVSIFLDALHIFLFPVAQ